MPSLNRTPRIILLLFAGTFALVFLLRIGQRTPTERPAVDAAPLVRFVVADAAPYRFSVTTQGAVSPRTESELIPQVSGEIVWVSPSLAAGGFFAADEPLARIDTADYRVDLEGARASVAKAESEHKRAKKELNRQRRLADRSVASQSRIDDAENAYRVADASLREARARLERAERDLARTELKAPYQGRVRSEQVDLGQFVTRGTSVARLYAVDYAEVRLPIPDRELAFLDIPLIPQAEMASATATETESPQPLATDDAASAREPTDAPAARGPRVSLMARFAGDEHHWEGQLVRTEGELDPRSRMVNLVARVEDPYGLRIERSAPLPVGLFVEAAIEGIRVDSAFVLPRSALREGRFVYTIDGENRIRFREVDVLRAERDVVVIRSGLQAGERICTSPLQAAIDGMRVRTGDEAAILAKQSGDAPTAAMPSVPAEDSEAIQ